MKPGKENGFDFSNDRIHALPNEIFPVQDPDEPSKAA
jgi:hypothetical protein